MMTQRTKFLLVALILVSAIVAIYLPALHYDFVGLDDDELVVRNADIKNISLDGMSHLLRSHYVTLYVPVTMLSYLLDYQVWHLTPFGFRFTNLVIHFMNAVLVFYFIWFIQKKFWIAFFVSLIFAVHPLQVESVIWVAERKNVLSTFFLLLAIISYWKAIVSDPVQKQKRLWMTLGLFVAALLSKPSAVVFLLFVFLINYFFFNGQHEFKKRFWFYASATSLCLLIGGLTVFGTATDVEQYGYHGGSYLTNFFVMMTVFWKYWLLLLFPYHQNILYLSPIYRSPLSLPVLFSGLGLILFFGLLWVLRKRHKPVVFWLSWFFVGLLPMSNLIAPLPSIMNDRYLYVPIIGFFAAFFTILEQLSSGLFFGTGRRGAQVTTWFGISLFIVPFVVVSVQRIPEWKNAETLWQSALRRAPREDSRIYYFYGINQLDRGNYHRSVELLQKSLSLHFTIDTLLALGTASVAAEKNEEAEKYLKQVMELDPKRSGAYDQLAVVYRKAKRFEEARPLYEKAIRLEPRSAVLYNNYALYFMDMGQPEKARELWEYALQLDPDCHFALRNLVWYYFLRKQWDPAAFYLLGYLRRDPNDKQMRHLIPLIESNLSPKEITSLPA